MEQAKKKRTVQRGSFTKALNNFQELCASGAAWESFTVAFQVLEGKMEELNATSSLILDAMFDTPTTSEAELCKESEDADEYKSKFLAARYQFNERLKSKSSAEVQTAPPAGANETKKTYKLPRIELIKFNGEIREWLPFWSRFKKIHEDSDMDKEDKFQYLIQATVPGSRASELVTSYPPTGENYEKVISSLKNRFGREDLQIEVYVRELLQLVLQNAISPAINMQLSTLYDKIESYLRALESLGVTTDKCAAMLFPLVESSLPEELLRAWQRSNAVQYTVESEKGGASTQSQDRLTRLIKFLEAEVQNELRITMAVKGFDLKVNNNNSDTNRLRKPRTYHDHKDVPSATSLVATKVRENVCLFCGGKDHISDNCPKAKKMSLSEKRELIKQKHACFICLKTGHGAKMCRVYVKCAKCSRRHVTVMCPIEYHEIDKISSRKTVTDKENTLKECNMASVCNDPQVYLPTLRAKLRSETSDRIVRVMLDTGSQKSYITKEVAALVSYEPISEQQLNHSLFGGTKSGVMKHKKYWVRLVSLNNSFACKFAAFDQDVICVDVPLIERDEWCKELQDDIHILDLDSREQAIDVLIGADIAGKFLTGRQQVLKCGLVVVETLLGWTVMGKIPGTENRRDPVITAISMFVKEENVADLWSLDVLGIKDPIHVKTQQEQEIGMQQEFLKTVTVNPDGRYEVELPWVESHPELGDNKTLAVRRLQSTIRKLRLEENFEKYEAVLQQWVAEGIVEYVNGEEEEQWGRYLPHRAVIKEGSTTAIRPVFDASAREPPFPSLNECLHKGPNLIELVTSILLRFRQGSIGVISDIKKAFLQISLRPKDRDFLRFLWVDKEGKTIVLRHCRVVFGVSCSPFILGAIIIMHLEKIVQSMGNGSNVLFDRDNIVKLSRSFYVDNCVTSFDSMDQLDKFIADSRKAMELASFDLRGWEYNGDDTHKDQVAVLGIIWDKRNDTLSINTARVEEFDLRKVTKRSILSLSHKLFDPLGFICPVVLAPRLMLQETWAKKLSWDEEVSEDVKSKFIKWSRDLKILNEVHIPRCLLGRVSESDKVTLHTFCDASKTAYAAVVFIRIERGTSVTVNFVQAKNRVAPIKGEEGDSRHSIPRLELLAATIGIRLTDTILKAFEFKRMDVFYWTDSSTVLAWIKRQCNWATFVWNRVEEIKKLSSPKQWRHVPGQFNPADLPSRGCTANHLLSSKWWEGPDWLRLPAESWPSENFACNDEEINLELRKTAIKTCSALVMLVNNNESNVRPWYDKYSSYSKIIRVVAWMKRFYYNCKRKNDSRELNELSVEELRVAEINIFRLVQSEHFSNKDYEHIKPFKPFKDEHDLIRVSSKVILREDTYNFRFPIILPGKHNIVFLIIKENHEKLKHAGVEITLGVLRETFWIIGGRKVVRAVIKKCIICQRYNAQSLQPPPPPLPLNRVREAAVFEVIGVDFTGPVYLKKGQKAWICLFTCAVYRAVHFELVSSLSTASFLMALRRHIARRGRPTVIYSDNGTNFVGLNNMLRRVDFKRVAKTVAIEKMQWIFNPPTAAWWGGFWERLNGILKRLLRRTLNKSCLDYEEMLTVLLDCEAIINCRPITFMSENDHDTVPLSPSMFLQEIKEIGVIDLDKVENCQLNKRYAYRQRLKNDLRQRFRSEYLGALAHQRCKTKNNCNVKIGDIVLIGSDNSKRINWPLARVKDIFKGTDGNVRVVRLTTATGELVRPIQRVYPLELTYGEHKCIDESVAKECENNHIVDEPVESPTVYESRKVQITRSGRTVKIPERLNYDKF